MQPFYVYSSQLYDHVLGTVVVWKQLVNRGATAQLGDENGCREILYMYSVTYTLKLKSQCKVCIRCMS